MANPGAAGLVLFVKSLDVLDADPDPRSGLPLVPPAEIDPGAVARHAREVVITPVRVLEPQHVGVIAKAGRHVRDPQDRCAAFESRSWHRRPSKEVCSILKLTDSSDQGPPSGLRSSHLTRP